MNTQTANENQGLTVRDEIENLTPNFKAMLPPHVPVERFVRNVLTAIVFDPQLAQCERRSLLEAALRAAGDGLLPDKKEAAFIPFNTNIAKKGEPPNWIKKVQYIPMVAGLLKKIRNSSELQSITAQIVFENDQFEYRLGDDEKIHHVPLIKGPRGKPIAAYSIAKTKDGGTYRELMLADEIEVTRNFSKAKDTGPWAGPFFLEMWKKTVLRRLSKRLPMSTDLVDRDEDETTDVTPSDTESEAVRRLRKSLADYCERNGGGSAHGILRDLVGHDSFDDLTDQEAERAHRDFESRYLGAEAGMD